MPPARRSATPATEGARYGVLRASLILIAATAGMFLAVVAAPAAADEPPTLSQRAEPMAGAFVYPVGDELDFTHPHAGERSGFTISDSYLVVRDGKHGRRTHKGVDLSCGGGGAPVRAIASGVVVVADAHAQIRTRQARNVKVTRVVKGKKVARWVTRYRTTTRWRTGWGNYVVIRHTLPGGETVHSLYGHLKPGSLLVHSGDLVSAGEMIARVGQSGRATSPHLHLEIRKSEPDPRAGDDFDPEDAEEATVQDRTFALLATVDPMAFLESHVRRFEDLDPHGWETRYALAACRDGVLAGDGDHFEPDDAITRGDYYAALTAAFGLGSKRGTAAGPFDERRAALIEAGVLNPGDRSHDDDHLKRSEALELLLRCLDRFGARNRNLAAFARADVASDFNRVFAGEEAAVRADRDARLAALSETEARRKAADVEYRQALRAQKAAAATPVRGRRVKRVAVKRPVVKPAAPQPRLDPGFEAIAKSDTNLSRAEACLLLASAARIEGARRSALEQAAARAATTAASEAASK